LGRRGELIFQEVHDTLHLLPVGKLMLLQQLVADQQLNAFFTDHYRRIRDRTHGTMLVGAS